MMNYPNNATVACASTSRLMTFLDPQVYELNY